MDVPGGSWSRRSVLAGAGSALALGSGCLGLGLSPARQPSDWPQRGYDAGHTNYKTEGSPPIEDVEVDWRVSEIPTVVDPQRIWETNLAVGNGTVFTANWTAIALEDGRVIRRGGCIPDTGFVGFARTNAYGNGVILSTSYHNRDDDIITTKEGLYGLRPSAPSDSGDDCQRTVRWRSGFPTDETNRIAGAIDDGSVIAYGNRDSSVQTLDRPPGRVAAIDTDDGATRWQTDDVPNIRNFCRDDRSLFVRHSTGEIGRVLTVFDRETGSRREQMPIRDDDSLRAARDGVAYLQTENKFGSDVQEITLAAVSGSDGEIKWRTDPIDAVGSANVDSASDHIGGVAVGPDAVFTTVPRDAWSRSESACIALDPDDGSVIWSRLIPGGVWWIAATDQSVYISGTRVVCLDRSNGDVRWVWKPEDAWASGPPVIADRRLLVPMVLSGVRKLFALIEP